MKLQKILAVLLAALLLAGCAEKAPASQSAAGTRTEEETGFAMPEIRVEEDAFRFTRENFPRLDGSTSLVPLGQGIASVLLGVSREEAANLISFHRTTESFRRLMRGECDLVIAAEPKAEVFQEMEEDGFRYEMETIAREALVFVVNENNPVDSLTAEQLRDIYSGAVTNWAQVGGEDAPIEAFQRNPTAGSQVMMEKLVMQGTPMMEAALSHIPGEMGELIEAVKSYDNSASAIGYTVYYYAADMQMARGLKILKVDGVLPQPDTLRSGAYPFLNGYYCCIPEETPEDAPARQLYRWLVSDAGQQLLNLEGYVSAHTAGEGENPGSAVYLDFSGYVPNGGIPAKYSLLPGGTPERLQPSDDYGMIYPYTGKLLYQSYDAGASDYQAGSLQGFFSTDGQLLTQPVYADIYSVSLGQDRVWILTREAEGDEMPRCAFAAADGSFVSEEAYTFIYTLGGRLFCEKDPEGFSFDIYNADGTLWRTEQDFLRDGRRQKPMQTEEGLMLCWVEDWEHNCVYDEEGRILAEGGAMGLDEYGDIRIYTEGGQMLLNRDGTFFPFFGEPEVAMWSALSRDYLFVQERNGNCSILSRDGVLLDWDLEQAYSLEDGGFAAVAADGLRSTRYYDADGRLRFGGTVSSEWDYTNVGSIFCRNDGEEILRNFDTGEELRIPGLTMAFGYGGNLSVDIYAPEKDEYHQLTMNADLETLTMPGDNFFPIEDRVNGQPYLMCMDSYGFGDEERVYTPDGTRELFRGSGLVQMVDGYITLLNDWAFSFYSPEGELLFCWPFYGLGAGD